MRLSQIQNMARSLGVKDTWKYSKKELIKTIQLKEGNFDCFSTAMENSCNQIDCVWRSDCIKS